MGTCWLSESGDKEHERELVQGHLEFSTTLCTCRITVTVPWASIDFGVAKTSQPVGEFANLNSTNNKFVCEDQTEVAQMKFSVLFCLFLILWIEPRTSH